MTRHDEAMRDLSRASACADGDCHECGAGVEDYADCDSAPAESARDRLAAYIADLEAALTRLARNLVAYEHYFGVPTTGTHDERIRIWIDYALEAETHEPTHTTLPGTQAPPRGTT